MILLNIYINGRGIENKGVTVSGFKNIYRSLLSLHTDTKVNLYEVEMRLKNIIIMLFRCIL